MTHIPEPLFTTGHDRTTLTLHRQTLPPHDEPVLLLRVTAPRTGIATAHLTDTSARLLAAAIHDHLDAADTHRESDTHHIEVDGADGTAPDPDHLDPWAAVPPTPAYVADPGPLELHRAQTALAEANRDRDTAAAWLARVHCQHAAYTVALAYPDAAWITVDLRTPDDDGALHAALVAVLDPQGNPLIDHDSTDPVFHTLAFQVNRALRTALAIAPGLLDWTGRRSLHLSHYATW
ncbi:hypothetical protein ThrDRAFT_03236 [Frankia casuarinae]|uniref:hypothetical protein n=1 Tax=Frankia casuarinae (strain DSM 45818 / CECT 9043 / HFP020203 / CcI3) TaxID=106370 RepID=UPI0002E4F5E1|nr:hypothetical protein [Frankia casuarinae]EYT91134.1 hypothetical protein ThrDRAFT_03236 [Frankia casuarinae]